jgi:hypothetical protein
MRNSSFRPFDKMAFRVIAIVLLIFLAYYIYLPPINVASHEFWTFLLFVLVAVAWAVRIYDIRSLFAVQQTGRGTEIKFGNKERFFRRGRFSRIFLAVLALPLAVMLVGGIISTPIFNAAGYAGVITVAEEDFMTDMPETDQITNIALMDTDSARILGARQLGDLANVVSQYVASENYTQINYRGRPMKVANLEYDGFFKWLTNRQEGIPGYIMVDAIGNKAQYKELEAGMLYAESAFFGKDLTRALRFSYPTKIFDHISFEVDEEGHAYYIVSCAAPRVGLFGAMDVNEVIIFDPVTGKGELYPLADVPKWVDIVFDGYLACEKYDWYGTLSGGYINSIIGNKGCKKTTADFGYIMLDDDVWYFTGVTSVTSDSSNIGFILSCARTGEYKFYPVVGAEEYSAMGAAEGEVQEKGYEASFPSLINIAGEPTYIMVLKNQHGLVELYALVHVEQYGMVATGETQEEAKAAYLKLLAQSGVDVSGKDDLQEKTVTVGALQYVQMSGVTYVYLTDEAGDVYRIEFNAKNEAVILLGVGDRVLLRYAIDAATGIRPVSEFRLTE